MEKTKIDWCDSTWNPVTGCLHGCEYCYARNIAKRFGGWYFTSGSLRVNIADDKTYIHPMADYYGEANETEDGVIAAIDYPFKKESGKKAPYPFGFTPTLHRYRLDDYAAKKGRNIFVCSMADLFGDWVPDEWIREVFEACKKAPQHNYLFLTKNPKRYGEYKVKPYTIRGAFNLWYGMSITRESDLDCTWMLPEYCNTFISIEPILEDLQIVKGDLRLTCLDWVIIGAETGRRKDKVVPERKWIDDIVNECQRNETPIFMKSSLAPIWGEPLIQEFPEGLKKM